MAGYAIVFMSPCDVPEGRGRMAHMMHNARALHEAGEDVKIFFEGIGVTWLKEWDTDGHPFTKNYRDTFEAIRPLIAGACDFCSRGRFKVAEHVDNLGIPHVGGEGKHHTLLEELKEGRQVLTF